MPNIENDEDLEKSFDDGEVKSPKKGRKIFLLVLISLFIIGGSAVGFFQLFQPNLSHEPKATVQVVKKDNNQEQVFYDFPKMNLQVKSPNGEFHTLRFQFNLELTSSNDIPILNGLSGAITDAVIAYTTELTLDEVSGVNGLYWLKEELLHRINLITDPVKVSSINVKIFEFQKKDN